MCWLVFFNTLICSRSLIHHLNPSPLSLKMQLPIIPSLLILLFASASSVAGENQVEFSADIFQSMPQQEPQQGRIYIGNDQVRTDISVGGKTMIQIIDIKQQTAYMLEPEQKSYMERKAGPGELRPGGGAAAKDANPCAGMQNLVCNRIGVETVDGRSAEKWELENTTQAQAGKMVIWIDQKRHIPVRQSLPDGTTMEMRLAGRETLNGRNTEKWEMKVTRPGGQSSIAKQWFDPELNMNIREEQPGGFVNELRNIRIGKQPADLFAVPPDYKMMSIPQGGGAPGHEEQGSYR
jgi:hypothetical protein